MAEKKFDRDVVMNGLIEKANELPEEKRDEAIHWLIEKNKETYTTKDNKKRYLTPQKIQSDFNKQFFPKARKATADYAKKRDEKINRIDALLRAQLRA